MIRSVGKQAGVSVESVAVTFIIHGCHSWHWIPVYSILNLGSTDGYPFFFWPTFTPFFWFWISLEDQAGFRVVVIDSYHSAMVHCKCCVHLHWVMVRREIYRLLRSAMSILSSDNCSSSWAFSDLSCSTSALHAQFKHRRPISRRTCLRAMRPRRRQNKATQIPI